MTDPMPGVTTAPIFQAGAGPAAATPEYEFSEADNAVFRDLAVAMRFVAAGNAVLGAVLLLAAAGGMYLNGRGGLPSGVAGSLAAGVAVVTCTWLRAAAVDVEAIATTRGSDISHLMTAMVALRRMFTLQRTLMSLAGVLCVPTVFVAVFLIFKSYSAR